MFDNPGLQSGNVSEILDEYDRVSGYCVDLFNGDIPSGYVIIDIASTQPVVMDFCIEPNAQNPYKTIEETFELPVNEEVYYSFAPFDYQIYVPQDNVIAGIKGQTELTQSFETYKANIAAKNISRFDEQKLNGINELGSDDKYSGVTAVITSTY